LAIGLLEVQTSSVCVYSDLGKILYRWLTFGDPTLLRLGNISRSASTIKADA
jgi:hypothetical protein